MQRNKKGPNNFLRSAFLSQARQFQDCPPKYVRSLSLQETEAKLAAEPLHRFAYIGAPKLVAMVENGMAQ